jgi:DNA (cytosine-5)-methyltransferase 1
MEKEKINVLSLFDGLSGGQISLNKAGIKYDKYYSSEVDEYAIKITQKNYPNTIQLGDVTKWREWNIDFSTIDLLCAGFPCQAWSFSGKQGGASDPRGMLMFTMMDIFNHIRESNPNVKFLFENVKMKKEFQEYVDSVIGVKSIFIDSSLLLPTKRIRQYWTNIPNIEQPKQVEYNISDFIEGYGFPTSCGTERLFKRKPIFSTLTATYWKGIRGAGRPAVSTKEGHMDEDRTAHRMLTPTECELIMGVPKDYTDNVSKTRRYHALGNGWVIDVIVHIFKNLK